MLIYLFFYLASRLVSFLRNQNHSNSNNYWCHQNKNYVDRLYNFECNYYNKARNFCESCNNCYNVSNSSRISPRINKNDSNYSCQLGASKSSIISFNGTQKTCNTGYRRSNLPKTVKIFKNKNTPRLNINNKHVNLLRDKSLQKTRKSYKENKNASPKTKNIQQFISADSNHFISDPNKNKEYADDYIRKIVITEARTTNLRTQINLIVYKFLDILFILKRMFITLTLLGRKHLIRLKKFLSIRQKYLIVFMMYYDILKSSTLSSLILLIEVIILLSTLNENKYKNAFMIKTTQQTMNAEDESLPTVADSSAKNAFEINKEFIIYKSRLHRHNCNQYAR